VAQWTDAGRAAARAAAAGGILVAGATAGVVAERLLVRKSLGGGLLDTEGYGTVRGDVVPVTSFDGTELYVEVDEAPKAVDNLTIIFAHGFTLNQDAFHYQRTALRGLARLVFFDQRGHGRSGHGVEEPASLDQLGLDLRAVIEATSPTGPLVLVGHSMGGMTIMSLAEHHPELFGDRVRGVALLATSAGGVNGAPLNLPPPIEAIINRTADAAGFVGDKTPALIAKSRSATSDLMTIAANRYGFGSKGPVEYAEFTARMIASTPFDTIVDLGRAFAIHDKRQAIEAFHHVESLVVVGDSDVITPHGASRDMVRIVPGAELVVLPQTGHMLLLERHVEVSLLLRRLVSRVRANIAAESDARAS
jgi:pimeloyl-ACP methyl ester carboxylesterase